MRARLPRWLSWPPSSFSSSWLDIAIVFASRDTPNAIIGHCQTGDCFHDKWLTLAFDPNRFEPKQKRSNYSSFHEMRSRIWPSLAQRHFKPFKTKWWSITHRRLAEIMFIWLSHRWHIWCWFIDRSIQSRAQESTEWQCGDEYTNRLLNSHMFCHFAEDWQSNGAATWNIAAAWRMSQSLRDLTNILIPGRKLSFFAFWELLKRCIARWQKWWRGRRRRRRRRRKSRSNKLNNRRQKQRDNKQTH